MWTIAPLENIGIGNTIHDTLNYTKLVRDTGVFHLIHFIWLLIFVHTQICTHILISPTNFEWCIRVYQKTTYFFGSGSESSSAHWSVRWWWSSGRSSFQWPPLGKRLHTLGRSCLPWCSCPPLSRGFWTSPELRDSRDLGSSQFSQLHAWCSLSYGGQSLAAGASRTSLEHSWRTGCCLWSQLGWGRGRWGSPGRKLWRATGSRWPLSVWGNWGLGNLQAWSWTWVRSSGDLQSQCSSQVSAGWSHCSECPCSDKLRRQKRERHRFFRN